MKNLKPSMIVLTWFAVIFVIALFCSCTTLYNVSERKIAPIVNNYDVKQIKSQTAHNVIPKN